MSDLVQRPLSADIAKKTFPHTAGVLVADREYMIQHSTTNPDFWMRHRPLGVMTFRAALQAFADHRANWTSSGQMRLMSRPLAPWEVAATEETLAALEASEGYRRVHHEV